jgi:hypothetical protein
VVDAVPETPKPKYDEKKYEHNQYKLIYPCKEHPEEDY